MIDFSLEEIVPSEARRILSEHDEAVAAGEITNRGRKSGAIRRYSSDIKSNQWFAETGETLKFSSNEKLLRGRNLLDGQNRLAAIIEADLPIKVYVARGVAKEAFSYIDGGEKRTLRDILRINQEQDADHLSRALAWLCQWDSETGRLKSNAAVTTQRARRFLESDPAIRKSVIKAKTMKDSGLMSVGLAAFLHRIFSTHDAELADKFIQAVASGAKLDESDPFYMLREKLIENKGSRRKLPQRDIVALAVKAWNFKRSNRQLRQLRFSHKTEEVPSLESAQPSIPEVVPTAVVA